MKVISYSFLRKIGIPILEYVLTKLQLRIQGWINKIWYILVRTIFRCVYRVTSAVQAEKKLHTMVGALTGFCIVSLRVSSESHIEEYTT